MKLTKREKILWSIVGVAVLAMLIFNLIYSQIDRATTIGVNRADVEETRRLLRSEQNIVARQKAASEALAKAQKRFLDETDPEAAKIELLREVENIAGEIGLAVEQKNLLQLEKDIIGVALEGTTEPAALTRFLHTAATSRLALNVKRLQLHTNQKTKQIRYQIILQLLLVEKKAEQ
ncbi:MAG: hypothetical protein GX075_05880 [Firmicutes bacterium]|nr:hypothetical protein [Bacillota bacterium]